MSFKKRILRILLFLTLIAVFAGYFAFSTFFFSPLEGGLDQDVATLIPRNVDFFVARAKLRDVFEEFPNLAVQDELEGNEAWRTWIGSKEQQDLSRDLGWDSALEELNKIQSQLPLGMTLLDIFGSEDIAIAGYFRGSDFSQADWAAYGRVNWAGKMGVALLSYPGLANLEAQGLTAVEADGVVELSGGQLPRPIYLTRVLDVVVASTSKELTAAAPDLYSRKGQDSFFQSALYFDHINNVDCDPGKDEIEVFVDVRKMYESLQIAANWPDPKSQEFVEAFLGRYFQLNSTKLITGVIGMRGGLSADLHGEFSSELITPLQNRTYRARGIDRRGILLDYAKLAPRDSSLFVALQGNVGDLLRQVFESMEPDMRNLIEEAFQTTGVYNNLDELVAELDGSLKNRLVLVVRPNDYAPDPEGPPHDAVPVPAVAIVAWMEKGGSERIVTLRDLVGRSSHFGLKGAEAGQSGYYKHFESGYETREFWSEFVPGTGVIATVNAADKFIVANSFQMLKQLLKTYFSGEVASLADREDFGALVQSSLAEANVTIWINPESTAKVLRSSARYWAEENVPGIDWVQVRAQFEAQVMRDNFPGKNKNSLSAADSSHLDELVQPMLDDHQTRHWDQHLPALLAAKERQITYLEAAKSMLMMLSLDPKFFELSVRVVAPIED